MSLDAEIINVIRSFYQIYHIWPHTNEVIERIKLTRERDPLTGHFVKKHGNTMSAARRRLHYMADSGIIVRSAGSDPKGTWEWKLPE